MTIIDNNTVVIFSYTELKSVLEASNSYTYIYFGANIQLTSGISISATKVNVVLDGTYENVRYQFEDRKSLSTGDTISVSGSTTQKVTVKNMDVTGYNYYGIIYVPESDTFKDTVIEYNNITYRGPQITFHPNGLSRYIDCVINIVTNYATTNEVAECNRIEIGGKTTIVHTSTADTMFWFRGTVTPYLHILENAQVTLTSTNRELFYGVTNLNFSVLKNATVVIETKNGMGYENFSTNQVLLDSGSSTTITQTRANGSYPTWFTTGPFIVNSNASLFMYQKSANTTTNNYNIYFKTNQASLSITNPKHILLYNIKADTIYTNSQIPFEWQFSRINLWSQANTTSNAGTLDDIPNYYWYKQNALASISGTISTTATTVTTNNFSSDELQKLFPLSSFQFQGKKVISIGNPIFSVDTITNKDLIITGQTMENANVQIQYETQTVRVVSDTKGKFSLTLTAPLAVGTDVKFLINEQPYFSYRNVSTVVVDSGELSLKSAPSEIYFATIPYSQDPILCQRKSDLEIVVEDTRVRSTNWKLYAYIEIPLTSNGGYKLTDSLVYIDENQTIIPLSKTPLLIYQGIANGGVAQETKVSFSSHQGILLRVMNEPLENGEEYKTNIFWALEE